MSRKSGQCLCGAVKVSVDIKSETFDVCHCSMCRRWAGGPAMTVDVSLGAHFEGEESIASYDSSPWAKRGFCKHCGTHLFYRLKGSDFINMPLGLLDEVDSFRFQTQIFIDNKPSCYDFANNTKKMTEAEVLALYAPK